MQLLFIEGVMFRRSTTGVTQSALQVGLLSTIVRVAAVLGLCGLGATEGFAASYWWNGNANTDTNSGGSYATQSNWSLSATVSSTNGTTPAIADDVTFNINSKNNSNMAVSLGSGNQAANSLTFSSTGATTIVRSGGTSSSAVNFTIGSGGMTLSATAGPVTFGEDPLKKVVVKLSASSTFTNSSPSLVKFVKAVEPASSVASGLYTLTLAGSGTGGFQFDDVVGNNSTTGTLALTVNTAAAALINLGTANTFTGGLTLTQGVLGLGSGSALGSGAVAVNGGAVASMASARTVSNAFTIGGDFKLGGQGQSITLNGTMDLGGATRTITLGNSATIGGTISNGGLILSGSSGGNNRRLLLSGSNSYVGPTTVSSGTLQAGSATAFGGSSLTVAANASLDLGNFAITNAIANNGGTILNASSYAGTQTLLASATYSSLSGASILSVGSAGKATLSGSIAGTLATLAGGTAELASGGSLAQASVANAGKFIFSGTANASLATTFTGAGSFQKDSGSILSLTGSSFFGAGTQVTAGGLLVTGSVGGGTVDVASAASIGGSGRLGGDLSFQSGANFRFVAGDTLTVGGNTTFAGFFGIANILGVDATTPEGTYTLIGGAVNFANVTNVGANSAYDLGSGKSAYLQSGSLQMVVVPEPIALSLIAGAALVGLLYQRRKSRRAA